MGWVAKISFFLWNHLRLFQNEHIFAIQAHFCALFAQFFLVIRPPHSTSHCFTIKMDNSDFCLFWPSKGIFLHSFTPCFLVQTFVSQWPERFHFYFCDWHPFHLRWTVLPPPHHVDLCCPRAYHLVSITSGKLSSCHPPRSCAWGMSLSPSCTSF